MAPLLFSAQLSLLSLWFSWCPPSASTDRCFLQLNSSRTEASLNKIRCTFSLQAPSLVQWLPLAERPGPLQVGTVGRLAPATSRGSEPLKWRQAGVCASEVLGKPNVQPGQRTGWVVPAGLASLRVPLASDSSPALSWPLAPSENSLLLPALRAQDLQLLKAQCREIPVGEPPLPAAPLGPCPPSS